jgi:hypothetical protein
MTEKRAAHGEADFDREEILAFIERSRAASGVPAEIDNDAIDRLVRIIQLGATEASAA